MSGGYFDYKNYQLNDWSRQLKHLIRTNNEEDEYGYKRNFKDHTIQVFYCAAFFTEYLEFLLHEIDYLVSSDIDEDTMMINIAESMVKLLEKERNNMVPIIGKELFDFVLSNFNQTQIVTPSEKDTRQMEMF